MVMLVMVWNLLWNSGNLASPRRSGSRSNGCPESKASADILISAPNREARAMGRDERNSLL
jgi:hypothetical protein